MAGTRFATLIVNNALCIPTQTCCKSTKVDEIQTGLLRFRHNDSQASLHVKVKSSGVNSIHCVIYNQADLKKMVQGKVSLIQKSDKNYLYISGEIEKQAPKIKKHFLSVLSEHAGLS